MNQPADRENARKRIESVDLVRGFAIILMALDHSHDFFGDLAANPTDLTTTTAALFFTRWITHFCAPAFFLLTGTGANLMQARLTRAGLSRFLITRGLWLILLELVVLRFALQFNIDYRTTIVTVLWALGWSMIALAGLIWLPLRVIAVIGVIMIAGHNALDGFKPAIFGAFAPLWTTLHVPGPVIDNGRSWVFISYPLIPWIGVTAMGYVLGEAWHIDTARRQRLLSWLGTGLAIWFVIFRLVNRYGDPAPWSHQHSALWTALSFLNTSKYPPSLLYLLMTLGPVLLLLRAFDNGVPRWLRPALIFGKVPLFFFVVHFFLIHLLAVAASYLRHGSVGALLRSPDLAHFPFSQPPGWDVGLPTVYLIWIGVVAALFPLCRWYAGVKQTKRSWWLSYL